ncbi:MAG: MFS transporter [Thermoplasmatota archaeon]
MTAAAPATGKTALAGFHPQFWIVNAIELLERGAYYGMIAVFTVYMVRRGLSESTAGLFVGLLQPLLYFVPPFAAALAEWLGARRTLTLAFSLATIGYLVLANVTTDATILLGIVVFGLGAGLFKPVAAAIVAQASTPARRNFAFTIYYMGINIGAFLVPLGVAFFLVARQLYAEVFYVAAALAATNLVLTLVLVRDLKPRSSAAAFLGKLRAVARVLRSPVVLGLLALTLLCAYAYFTGTLGFLAKPSALMLAGAAALLWSVVVLFDDAPFATLLLIYSGLWFMYAQFQFWAPVYMLNFGLMPAWFNEAYYATLNPLVIIALGFPLGKLVERLPSLPTVVGGIALYAVGIILLGLAPIGALFIAGVVVVSIAELAAHPSFLSYVSKTATPQRQSVYLGLSFIPVGIGLSVGAATGGDLYGALAHDAARPGLFWAIVAAVGLVTLAALIAYNHWLTRRRPDSDRDGGPSEQVPGRNRESERGSREGDAGARIRGDSAEKTHRALATLAHPRIGILALLLIPLLVIAGITAGTQHFTPLDANGNGSTPAEPTSAPGIERVATIDGYTASGATTERNTTLHTSATRATFTLNWTDEPASTPATTNTPDTFQLTIALPNGTTIASPETANPQGGTGTISLTIQPAPLGTYTLRIKCVNAGGDQALTLALPVSPAPDAGNAWRLEGIAAR